ncbi:hypothetical protein PPYR_02851 [Photinus pyralis]|uniref:Peptidase S1 domain-containing protein n=2 Tax=Photinus pyralis TaxID=7054 RepID=A0A5N4A185_PHOPY|nr:trypsin alpha-3-like [Photinus pyralis]KAB0791051.1 hypothetical protein PPYR_02851 [Photinus pyralis]
MQITTLIIVYVLTALVQADRGGLQHRIVQGKMAEIGQFPYQASLRNSSLGHFCGGAIVKGYSVITTAKCVQGYSPESIFVVVGTNELAPSGRTVAVVAILRHEAYDSGTLKNNIALLRTKEDVTQAYKAGKIDLNYGSPFAGQKCTLSGWGKESASALAYSNYLRYVELTLISVSECQTAWTGYDVDANNLCTKPEGKGGCHGDNGGPLVNNNNVLYGLLSWGYPCATNKPDVYVSIARYANWINERAM